MGTSSWVLVGSESSERSFGSSCYGAGRTMSRTPAKKEVKGQTLQIQLAKEGIHVQTGSMKGLAEEAPIAYKDVEDVVSSGGRACT